MIIRLSPHSSTLASSSSYTSSSKSLISLTTKCILTLTLLPSITTAFYLPGAAPKDYSIGDRVPLLVNSLTPQLATGQSQLKSLISYDYYDPGFGFCQPKEAPEKQSESLGSSLFGDRLYDSPFEIHMLKNVTCAHLCTTKISPESTTFLSSRIIDSYALNWLIDGLPAAEIRSLNDKSNSIFYSMGFALGKAESIQPEKEGGGEERDEGDWKTEVNNHFDIYLEWHSRDQGEKMRVVGVVVWPSSVNSLKGGSSSKPVCTEKEPLILSPGKSNEIAYTYSVNWIESKTPWATRWDLYLRVFDPRIHILSLINSIVIALFLCLMVAMILLRTIHRDISRYNAIDASEEDTYAAGASGGGDPLQEDFGWKLVHGEVFRSPKRRMYLSVLVGSGMQLCAMGGVTLVFATLGFLSPSNRGSLSTVMLVSWTLFGIIAGFVSARLYATLKGDEWRKNMAMTAVLFPTFMFSSLHLLNFFLIGAGSSGAVPFGTFLAIVALWFLINIPLTVIGAYMGMKRGPLEIPVRVNQIPRQIPPCDWWLRPIPSALIAGLLPFGAAFFEAYFVLQSLFGAKAYYAFGFLALTSIVVVLTTATTTVLMCYFHLCAEDYRWQWRSFLAGGGSAFWLILYGLIFWATRLHLDGLANKVLFLGYLFLISLMSFIALGSVGFVSCFFFLRVIYSRIRVD